MTFSAQLPTGATRSAFAVAPAARAAGSCDTRAIAYQAVIEELRRQTDATRTTLRLDTPGQVFPVVAEALGPGVRSIAGDSSIDLRAAATFKYLDTEQRNLVQEDCSAGDFPAPPELIEFYGVKAQMLAPLVRDGQLIGIISVHYAPSTREWTEDDVAALDDAARRVSDELAAGGSQGGTEPDS